MMRRKKDNASILLIGLVYIMHLGCNSAENSKSGLSVKQIETESIAPISIGDIYNKQKYIHTAIIFSMMLYIVLIFAIIINGKNNKSQKMQKN